MILKWKERIYVHGWQLVFVVLLSACFGGAGVVAVVQIVTPLGGSWFVDPAIDAEKLNFNSNPPEQVFFSSELSVTARVTTTSGICGGGFDPDVTEVDLVGKLVNGGVALRRADSADGSPNCLEGRFTDLITLEAGPPGSPVLKYVNGRVDIQLLIGLWVSDGATPLQFKFTEGDSVDNDDVDNVTIRGCDLTADPVVKFIGTMNGLDTNTRSKPTIPELRSDDGDDLLLFSQVVYEDGATIKLLDALGDSVTLHRVEDTTSVCPP